MFSFFLISNKKIVIIISNSRSFCVGFLSRFPLVLVSFLCCNKIPAQTQIKGERVLLTHSYSLSLWGCQGSRKLKLLVTFHSQLTAESLIDTYILSALSPFRLVQDTACQMVPPTYNVDLSQWMQIKKISHRYAHWPIQTILH